MLWGNHYGQSYNVKGRYYGLACNGIETRKLLLISRSENTPEGVANSSGFVGRGLMDHPTVAVDFLCRNPFTRASGPLVVSMVDYGRDGSFRAYHAADKIFISNIADVQSYLTRLIEVEKDWENIDHKLKYFSNHCAFVGVEMEQLPHNENIVKPSEIRFDAIGIPEPEIHMRFDAYVEKAADHFMDFLNKIVGYLGAEKIRDYAIGQSNLLLNHPMGTCRMGNYKNISVVDSNCRCHDYANLFIAGSSVFTTGGTANPTLTIAALSLRLADYLQSVIQTDNL